MTNVISEDRRGEVLGGTAPCPYRDGCGETTFTYIGRTFNITSLRCTKCKRLITMTDGGGAITGAAIYTED